MRFDLSQLLKGPIGSKTKLDISERNRNLAKDLTVDLLEGTVEFTRTNEGIFAEGLFRTNIKMECVRCLEIFAQPLTFRLEERFLFPSAVFTGGPVFPILEGGFIDLSEPLREHILLAIPMRPLCRPDCRGLCSQCGQNLNEGTCDCKEEKIDHRLIALKELILPGEQS
jgi:uncharacterized protein